MKKIAALLMALSVSGIAMAQDLTEIQVRARLAEQGYSVNDMKYHDGMWKANAHRADGIRHEVRIDPRTGTVLRDGPGPGPGVRMSERDVMVMLADAGYSKVHDLEYEDGVWKAEAEGRAGKDFELTIDPVSGRVIDKERD